MQQLVIGNARYGLCGFVLLIISYALFFFDPVEIIKSARLKFVEGSFVYQLWQKPPIKLYVNVYIFNVTNADRFLSGEDDKLNVQEIGPYVYWEELVNTNSTFNSNSSVSYTPVRKLHLDLNLSIGNPETDRIIVPNIPLLGFGAMLRNSPMFVNLVFSSLVDYLDSKPILELTVKEFLWGYDDKLVKMASNVLPSWIDFSRFGILDRMLDEGNNIITMNVWNEKQTHRPYSIQQFNGSPILQQWVKNNEPNVHCSLNESSEGILFPRHMKSDMSFSLYRKSFCRPLKFTYDSVSVTNGGYSVYLYKCLPDVFNSSLEENQCYCPQDGCLPSGLSDISPCYYKIPVALSFPHFYNGDPSLVEGVNGIAPDQKKHESIFAIQPDLGIPLIVDLKIQLNLVIKSTNYVKRIQKFNDLTLPVFWINLEIKSLPDSLNSLLYLSFNVGPVLTKAAIALFAAVGFFLIGLSVRRLGRDDRQRCTESDFEYRAGDGGGDEDDCGGPPSSGLIAKKRGQQLTSSQQSVAGGKSYLPLRTSPSSVPAEYDYSPDPARGR